MNFSPKRSSEAEVFTVDLSQLLGAGETITSAVWSISVVDGSDPNPGVMISGGTSITGARVSQIIAGGVPFVTYAPTCTVQTSAGQTLVAPEQGLGVLYISG